MVKVVLSTFERPRLTAEAIESVLAQTYTPLHLVVVDDASTDSTPAVVAEYAELHPKLITFLQQPTNGGLANNMATGLLAPPIAGYVATMNEDDSWGPNFLERQVELLERDPSLALAYSEARVVDGTGRETGELFSDRYGHLDTANAFEDLLRANHACASTLVMTERIARLAGESMPEKSLVWDYWVLLVAASHGGIAFNPEPLATYRDSVGGLHHREREMWSDTTAAKVRLFAQHPASVTRVGGARAARRRAALLALDVAANRVAAASWREFAYHGRAVMAQRDFRASAWLGWHALRKAVRSVRPNRPDEAGHSNGRT